LYYRMYRPPAMQVDKRYPVLVRFYGGPGRQLVNRSFGDLFDQYMAQRGYVVFNLDNRGTPRRGRAFEEVIFGQLGKVEVADQLAGIAWLKNQSYVDAERIGVFGWSYGGYLALMLLAKASDQIAAGVAVAPVTDWRMYDNHFSERYLDTPANNPHGYAASSVLPYAADIRSPLLLIHGMADDNVLFTHSTRLMALLQEQGRQFELMTYPGGSHALSTPEQQKHVYTAIAAFFDARLKPET
jgi:dipeptidyl-peptidase-4